MSGYMRYHTKLEAKREFVGFNNVLRASLENMVDESKRLARILFSSDDPNGVLPNCYSAGVPCGYLL